MRDSSIVSVWQLASYGSSKALGSVHLSEWMHVHIIKLYVHVCLSVCEIMMSDLDCLNCTSVYKYCCMWLYLCA